MIESRPSTLKLKVPPYNKSREFPLVLIADRSILSFTKALTNSMQSALPDI